jgi:biopolymer transport protein ExbB
MLGFLDFSKIIVLFKTGGLTFFVLVCASIISISIILYKFFEFGIKSGMTRTKFISKLAQALKRDNFQGAITMCEHTSSPMGAVAKGGISAYVNKHSMGEAMEREIMLETVKLERFTTVLATIGSVSVYIGLFGTVLGIIRAFHDISTMGSGGISVVIGGVSEALIATAAGLFVAVPAVIAHNFIMKGVDKFVVNMEYCASAVESMLNAKTKIEVEEAVANAAPKTGPKFFSDTPLPPKKSVLEFNDEGGL